MRRTGERIIALLAVTILPVLSIRAQCLVTGIVRGMDGKVLQGVTLRLFPETSERILAFGFSLTDGRFRLTFEPSPGIRYRLVSAALNMHPDTSVIGGLQPGMDSLPNPLEIMLRPAPSNLEEVVVRSPALPFNSKGDTLEYDASRFRTAETSKVEHLLQKMNGFDLGPDGRIRYNGKEIDRILIDGEDIAEGKYRLISQNLGAGLVDKVQVLNDFSEDRLMREVGRSGRIGINLTIDSSRRGRPTGSIEAGAGIGGREWIDNSAIRVGDLLKSMAFLKYNETGETPGQDMDHHLEDSRQEDSHTNTGIQEIVATGVVPLPPLENSYVRDNRDLGSYVMANAKSGNGFRYKALFGLDMSKLRNEARSEDLYFVPGGSSWTMEQSIRSLSKSLGVNGRIGVDYDRGRSHTGRWRLVLNGGGSRDEFVDFASGAVADSLSEKLNSMRTSIGFHGEHAVRLGGGKVLKGILSYGRGILSQGFLVQTGRLSGLFHADSSQKRFWQELYAVGNIAESSLVLYGRGKATDWRMGWRLQLGDLTQRSSGWLISEAPPRFQDPNLSNSDLNTCRVEGFASLERRLSERTRVSAFLQTGFGAMEHKLDGRASANGFPLHSVSVEFRRRMSPLRFLNFEFSSSRLMQPIDYFHPTALITGEATVRWPASAPMPFLQHALRLRLVSNSLSKGREFMFVGSFLRSEGAYSLSYERTPSLLIAFPLVMPASSLIDVQARFQKYVVGLKTKTGVSGGALIMQERLLYNSLPGLHRTGQMHARWHAVTAFQGKADFEASLMATWITDRLFPETGSVSGFTQWNFQGHLKCRIRWSERIFSALMDRFYLLDRSRFVHALDMHASFTATPQWRFTLIGHNLLDIRILSQRMPGLGSLSERNTALVGRYVQLRVALDF